MLEDCRWNPRISHTKYRRCALLFAPGVSQFISQPFDLLLENERNSTQDHEHLSKCIFMLQLKMASVNFEGSEMWNAPGKKKPRRKCNGTANLPHKFGRRNLNFEKLKFFCKDKA